MSRFNAEPTPQPSEIVADPSQQPGTTSIYSGRNQRGSAPAGIALVAAAALTAVGIYGIEAHAGYTSWMAANGPHTTSKTDVTAKPGIVTGVFELSPELCVARVEAMIDNKAQLSKKTLVLGNHGITITYGSTMKGTLAENICAKIGKATTLEDPSAPRGKDTPEGSAPAFTIVLPEQAFSGTVYPVDPVNDLVFKPANNLGGDATSLFDGFVQEVASTVGNTDPSIANRSDRQQSAAMGMALEFGAEQLNSDCVAAAAKQTDLAQYTLNGIKLTVVKSYNAANPKKPLDIRNVAVAVLGMTDDKGNLLTDSAISPDKLIQPIDQYAAQRAAIRAKNGQTVNGNLYSFNAAGNSAGCSVPKELVTAAKGGN